jgi:hypothetical protein
MISFNLSIFHIDLLQLCAADELEEEEFLMVHILYGPYRSLIVR